MKESDWWRGEGPFGIKPSVFLAASLALFIITMLVACAGASGWIG